MFIAASALLDEVSPASSAPQVLMFLASLAIGGPLLFWRERIASSLFPGDPGNAEAAASSRWESLAFTFVGTVFVVFGLVEIGGYLLSKLIDEPYVWLPSPLRSALWTVLGAALVLGREPFAAIVSKLRTLGRPAPQP